MATTKILPYMGKPVETRKQLERRANTVEINMGALSDYERAQVDARNGADTDPYLVLTRKVTHLADLLGCNEDEAERILLNRLGA